MYDLAIVYEEASNCTQQLLVMQCDEQTEEAGSVVAECDKPSSHCTEATAAGVIRG